MVAHGRRRGVTVGGFAIEVSAADSVTVGGVTAAGGVAAEGRAASGVLDY